MNTTFTFIIIVLIAIYIAQKYPHALGAPLKKITKGAKSLAKNKKLKGLKTKAFKGVNKAFSGMNKTLRKSPAINKAMSTISKQPHAKAVLNSASKAWKMIST